MGEFHHSLDAKGRIILPSRFRDELQDSVIVTRGLDGCLNVYTQEAWQAIYEKLLTLPTTNKDARTYVRMMTAKASECSFDSQGRILLPQNLIKDAEIEALRYYKDCQQIHTAKGFLRRDIQQSVFQLALQDPGHYSCWMPGRSSRHRD